MSIINRMLIIPGNVQVNIQNFEAVDANNQTKEQVVEITGPQGRLVQRIFPEVEVIKTENKIFTRLKKVESRELELVGTLNSLLCNALKGVESGHQKELVIEGVRNKVLRSKNEELEFSLGASHPIRLVVPNGLEVNFPEKNKIIVKGINKEKVGEFAGQIRKLRKKSPYNLDGIYYKDEKVNLKKKASKK